MKLTTVILAATMLSGLSGGCRGHSSVTPTARFWEGVRSGEIRNFMIHGFAVGIRPDRFWPVAAIISAPVDRLDETKQRSGELKTIITTRLVGLDKVDITEPERRAQLEKELLSEIRSRLPKLPIQQVVLTLDVK